MLQFLLEIELAELRKTKSGIVGKLQKYFLGNAGNAKNALRHPTPFILQIGAENGSY